MLLLEEFNDSQLNADNICRFGGIAEISSRERQLSNISL
jgi:hypothetical protein